MTDTDGGKGPAAAPHPSGAPAGAPSGDPAAEAALPEPAFLRGLRRVDRAIATVEEVVVGLVFLALVGLGVYQSLKRRFAPPSPFWVSEAVRYAVFTIGVLGGAIATQAGRLFAIDLVTRTIRPRGRLVMRILANLFSLATIYVVIIGCMALIKVLGDEHGELINPATGALVMPICFGLAGFHTCVALLIDFIYLARGKVPAELVTLGAPAV